MSDRASVEEFLDFVNRVRTVVGAPPLERLLPGIPNEAEFCLLTANLPFDCAASNTGKGWVVWFGDGALARAVGDAVDCPVLSSLYGSRVVLPQKIAATAEAFDRVFEDPDALDLLPFTIMDSE